MKQYAGWFCFVLLLGVVLGFWAGKADVAAQTIDNKSTRWLAGTIAYGQWQEAFILFDTQTNRVAAYSLGGSKRFELLAVREISWDLKPVEYGKQHPSVQEMKKLFEKSQRDKRDKRDK